MPEIVFLAAGVAYYAAVGFMVAGVARSAGGRVATSAAAGAAWPLFSLVLLAHRGAA